jgi:hypothetical protein
VVNGGCAAPGESPAAYADAIAERHAIFHDKVQEAIPGIDDDRPWSVGYPRRHGDQLAEESWIDLIDVDGRDEEVSVRDGTVGGGEGWICGDIGGAGPTLSTG